MQNQNQEYSSRSASAISFEDISEFVYNSLVSLEGTNEQYKSDSLELYINFDIQLLQNNNELIKDYTPKQLKELGDQIIFLIEKGDSYSWIYKSSNSILNHLYEVLDQTLLTLSQSKLNSELWLKSVCSNFKPLESIIEDIKKFEEHRTQRYLNQNTIYWNM
ncbi:25082_t:CDS:2 [Cetraspora pellucida]|uniref:25082_t:CDS:1 n=1 Tax=Cetraspora pellucida TaxID=1433469 RepID=A0A9N9D2R9_9GLOM|nr:25082_t:CDS:2 [Cetraspora pellucida]